MPDKLPDAPAVDGTDLFDQKDVLFAHPGVAERSP